MLKTVLRHKAMQGPLAFLLGRYLAFALATTRWTIEGREHLAAPIAGAPAVFAFWHESLPLMPALWGRARRRNPALRVAVLVSRHNDGRFIGEVMRRLGLTPTHGSSREGGAAGARALIEALGAGSHAAITPDGPRGPRHVAALGVAHVAAIAGVPVLPCAAFTRPRLVLGSWDRMAVPLPFGRGAIICGAPLDVPRDGAEATLPAIAAALDAAAARAAALVG